MSISLTLGRRGSAPNAWQPTLSGLCASLVGIGLARFAYTPMLPALIGAGWFSASGATYLGAANLAGYLAGALSAAPVAARLPVRPVLRGMMLLAALAFAACGWPGGFAWFFAWRVLSGIAGGMLMVLTAPAILPHVPPSRRGLASGAIFMGVGLGIIASGTLVPLLLRQGVSAAWLGLAVAALLLTAVSWSGWPEDAPPSPAAPPAPGAARPGARLRAVYACYGLIAFALVPHMLFLVDFVRRGLHASLAAGATYWLLFGVGAAAGPLLAGSLADRIGFAAALRLGLLAEAVAIGLPAVTTHPAALVLSSVAVGAFTPGAVPLVLGRINGLLAHHPAQQRPAWAAATTSFAIMQAAGAYGLSFLLIRTGSHALLFALGAAAMVLALAVELSAGLTPPPASGPAQPRPNR